MPQCDGKKKFGTASLAEAVANNPRRPKKAAPHRVYQCRICSCYHLTSQPLRWWAR